MIDPQIILDDLKLKPYGAALMIAAETDETLIAVQMRWGRWLKGKPPSLAIAERDLQILGWGIRLVKLNSTES